MQQVAVTSLHKAFGAHPVLTGLDLEVRAGSLTAILGPSGSGKTTLLRLLAGFERADAGTISIGDGLVDGPGAYVPPERRRIGYVPQEGSLFPHLTVAANVGFGLSARERRGGRVASMLELVGLGGLGRRYPHQLSGGQQQRVALARALAIEPAVVLLDEPFASLDAHLRASVRTDVQEIFRRAGTTAILVTHDQDEALSMADRVAALRDGVIVQNAAPEDLYGRPVDADLARFVGDANLLEGVLDGRLVKTLLGSLPLDSGAVDLGPAGQVTVLIRPEQIELAAADDLNRQPMSDGYPGQVISNGYPARVMSYGYHGHDAIVRVRPDHASDADAPVRPDHAPDADAPVRPDHAPDADAADDRTIVVRIVGAPHLPVGSRVTLRAHGPVFAWPRDLPARAYGVCAAGTWSEEAFGWWPSDGVPMAVRAQRAVRASGRVGAAILAAFLALTVTAPPSTASDVRAGAAHASAVAGPSGVLARAAAIAVAGTGQVLWSRDLDTELPMASITKVMTALVVIGAGDLSRKITVPAAVVGYVEEHDASNAGLWPGDILTARQLLEAMLLPSGADAAYTLAAAYGPGLVAFIAKMNATAKLLGMTRTHFSNFDGLPWPTAYSTYSTPANLIKLGRVAMTSAVFRSIVDRRSYRIAAGPGHHAYFWPNLNPLLGVYRGAIGIKTGYTPAAGHCLLFEATRRGVTFIGVTLDSPGVGTTVNAADATQMLNWAFSLPGY